MTTLKPHFPPEGHEKLFWIDGFLSPVDQRTALEELEFAFWQPSTVAQRSRGNGPRAVYSHHRVSETTDEGWFTADLVAMVRGVEKSLRPWLPRLRGRCEPWQATRYACGGRFNEHLDSGQWGHEPAGDRQYTLLVYLNTPKRGGGTRFPKLGLEVKAKAGRLVVWSNLTEEAEPDASMLHSSVPLREGGKTVLITWVRQRPFTPRRHA